eukprot:CAMPEP_0117660970 /NCGR_PEP_ID=MMETSP0804-20121206/7279_1 /TAXON_ID=1074897 /ORGANISM="Tetraselmis astigmatica, Strain CCMP880" /LENGTH=38 /DNA_ID= /DNA_START= /DNA_END= /DNA_ORIENTATION=
MNVGVSAVQLHPASFTPGMLWMSTGSRTPSGDIILRPG